MDRRVRQVGYFLSGQYFSAGLRITLSILLPALVFSQFDQLSTGITLSIGALSVTLADAPGPVQHRRNGMAIAALAGFLMTLITGFARLNDLTLGFVIGIASFFFSMFTLYGPRATSVGTGALLVMVLMMDRDMDGPAILRESGLVLAGGVWYAAISILSATLRPYRPAQQALSLCIHEIARFMAIKADFYRANTDINDDYRRLLAQQVVVSEQQNAVRELLFKSDQYLAEADPTGQRLVLTFSEMVDFYEQVVAMYYDYSDIRQRFGQSGVLDAVAHLIQQIADELDHLGLTVQTIVPNRQPPDFAQPLADLKRQIDALDNSEGPTLVLRKVLISLRNLNQRLQRIRANWSAPTENLTAGNRLEYGRFVSHQAIDWQSFRDNLTFDSSTFRFSLRMALALLLGYVVTKLMPSGHHSYWVLLTILVILKPAYSLTRQRNRERIIGTVVGGIIGVLILLFVQNSVALLVLMVLFMLGTYSALRINYIVMVICVTPFVLILTTFLGVSFISAAGERLLDTLLGGLIALSAGYALFPRWESDQLITPMRDVLAANLHYMTQLYNRLSGSYLTVLDYKLARKEVYVSSANLASAFQRMTSEPKHTQRNEKEVYEFVVLTHILSANVATLLTGLPPGQPRPYPAPLLRPVRRGLVLLAEAQRKLDPAFNKHRLWEQSTAAPTTAAAPLTTDESAMLEQLTFIQQVCADISAVTITKGLMLPPSGGGYSP
ncbi:FUSC family protein [Spirosoma montaniterrae]|uniref:Uncharacterized protein n=1 Tax=Spirosoma montaniterrae TaxID=1178516 RepID=A0A1P9WUU7_9BACT|nr:FUSC family membrane protein [Spirosoma montaniterrae]AQG79166.1 hypothetical protein AWR27_07415 [Spirosoma montaniterrae]